MTTSTESPPKSVKSASKPAALKNTWQHRLNRKFGLDKAPMIRKLIYSVVGVTLLLIGFAMIVLPGPAVIIIPVGLAILASEYAWARRIVRRGRVFVEKTKRRRWFTRTG